MHDLADLDLISRGTTTRISWPASPRAWISVSAPMGSMSSADTVIVSGAALATGAKARGLMPIVALTA